MSLAGFGGDHPIKGNRAGPSTGKIPAFSALIHKRQTLDFNNWSDRQQPQTLACFGDASVGRKKAIASLLLLLKLAFAYHAVRCACLATFRAERMAFASI